MPTIDENLRQSSDPLALLRPIAGQDAPAGLPPDSPGAPKVNGGNAFIWLASTRDKAIILEEIEAGLRDEKERSADAEPPARLWERIFNVAQQHLRDHGKDIRIAFFCLEAWIRRDGLTGLCAGLELLRGCIAAYWDMLHPLPAVGAGTEADRRIDCLVEYYAARDDVALDYSPLFFALNRHTPVAADGKNIFRLHDALEDGLGRADPNRIPENVRRAAALTPPETARAWLAACRRALENCAALEAPALAPEFAAGDIPFPAPGKLRRRVEEIEALLLALYSPSREDGIAAQPGADAENAGEEAAPGAVDLGGLISRIASNRRADNLRILRILGRRFQDTEPHSPVGYAVAHWAGMAELPLPKLLDAMGILGDGERSKLEVFAGVRAPDK